MTHRRSGLRTLLRSRWGMGVLAAIAVAGLLLIFDHWSHVTQSNLALGGLLLACLAMHMLMHGSHGGHGGTGKGRG